MDIIDLIDSRIETAMMQSNYLCTVPCIVTDKLDSGNVEVIVVSSGTKYVVPNLSGTALQVGQSAQLYYQGNISKYRMMFIGASFQNKVINLNYILGNITTGSVENGKTIFDNTFRAITETNIYINGNINYVGLSNGDISVTIKVDDVIIDDIIISKSLELNKVDQISFSYPMVVSSGLHDIKIIANGYATINNVKAYVMGIDIAEYKIDYDKTDDNDYVYNVVNGETDIYYYIGDKTRPDIPVTIGNGTTKTLTVTSFNTRNDIIAARIPDGVETIE